MDIAPTRAFQKVDRRLASAYWHWYFLQQPAPFPERLIGADPDFFYETCLFGWGAATSGDFDPEQLAEYRRAWRDPAMILAPAPITAPPRASISTTTRADRDTSIARR